MATRTATLIQSHPALVFDENGENGKPAGGSFHFFTLDNGRHVSVLDDGYPHHSGFEIHERISATVEGNDPAPVKLGTEQHAKSWAEVHKILDVLETAE